MGQQQYLIDTNAVIDYLSKKLPDSGMKLMNTIIDDMPGVSVITKIEVLGFNAPEEHYQLLSGLMNDVLVMELSDSVADESIDIRKKHKTKLPDAIIAATAIVHKLTLVTSDNDFSDIEKLQVINPYSL
jgi:hypothetical protein